MFRPLTEIEVRRLRRRLMAWYRKHGRSLPWRRTRDPYAIAVSEVMLQQTQVDRVVPKYQAWLKRFPTVRSLASARLGDVLKIWSGLGYNRRAIWLRAMARTVMNRFGGRLPRRAADLESLPGIGRYTSAAIAAFAFDQPVAAVDTNVRRVLVRHFWSGRQPPTDHQVAALAGRLVPARRSAEWNHALMDLGALVCRSGRSCRDCPWSPNCRPPSKTAGVRPRSAGIFMLSNRYVRGRIVKLAAERRGLTIATLRRELRRHGIDARRVAPALQGLLHDGFLRRTKRRILLAD